MWLHLVRVRLSNYLFVEKDSVLQVWLHSLVYDLSQNPVLERWQICHITGSPSQLALPTSAVDLELVDMRGPARGGRAENTVAGFLLPQSAETPESSGEGPP